MSFDPATKEFHQIINDPEEHEEMRRITGIEVLEIRAIDTDTFFVKFEHARIYDISKSKWKTIVVEGIYKRRQLRPDER